MGSGVANTPNNIFNFNEWTHVVFTYDKDAGGTDEVKIYVNGVYASACTRDYSAPIGTNNNNITIGQNSGVTFTNGKIDELSIYNRALSANEISELYRAGAGVN